jgi:hypothetical protein
MLLLLVVGIVFAVILIGDTILEYVNKLGKIIKLGGKLNVFMTNDDEGTELISLLGAKTGERNNIELLGWYGTDGIIEAKSKYIEPIETTMNNAFVGYDFSLKGSRPVSFQKGVPPAIQEETITNITGCGTSPREGDVIKLRWPMPASKTINSGFGGRELTKGECDCHGGIDIAGDGMDVYAAAEGIVDYVGWDPNGGGNYVRVKHEGTFGSGIYYTYYMHLKEPSKLKAGDSIGPGMLVGISGSTGKSTGSHLHFEIRDAGKRPDLDSIDPCGFFVDEKGSKMDIPGCEHEQVAVCKYVTGMIAGKPVRTYETDIPLPGALSGTARGTVAFKQWD